MKPQATWMKFLLSIACVKADFDLGWYDDSDLSRFVTHPEIKAPLFKIFHSNSDRVTPGLWFVAPYARINQDTHADNYYQPCQTGPHIYDGNGTLVWSGACAVYNQNTCDFRPVIINGSQYLTAIKVAWSPYDEAGRAVILDETYQETLEVTNPVEIPTFNMHEFKVIDGGQSALYIVQKDILVDTTSLPVNQSAGWIMNMGFVEVDLSTGQILFEWYAYPHIPLTESTRAIGGLDGPSPNTWNYLHFNSLDKTPDGDYIISARYTDCIYRVSGIDSSIVWRLGGRHSSFFLQDFNFSKQHDAQLVSQNETNTVISLLDNASDTENSEAATSSYSSGIVVNLDTSMMVARVIQRWVRPDFGLSRLRGNLQLLPSGNGFIGWSDNAYISEHTPDGEVVLEASFMSRRFVTYRAYKFNFTARPAEPPKLKSFAFGTSLESATTVLYVSWNGATEVSQWRFLRDLPEIGTQVFVGETAKDGFETVFHIDGYQSQIFAQAIDADGVILGRSDTEETEPPQSWSMPRSRKLSFSGTSNSEDDIVRNSPVGGSDRVAKTLVPTKATRGTLSNIVKHPTSSSVLLGLTTTTGTATKLASTSKTYLSADFEFSRTRQYDEKQEL